MCVCAFLCRCGYYFIVSLSFNLLKDKKKVSFFFFPFVLFVPLYSFLCPMLFRYFSLETKKVDHKKRPTIKVDHLRESIIGPYQAINGRHSPAVTSYLCQKALTSGCSLRTAEEELHRDHAFDIKFDSEGILAACVTAESSFRIINFDDSAVHSSPQEILSQRTLCPCKVVSWRPASDGTGEQTDIVCCPTGAQHPIALYNLETCTNNVPTLIIKRKEGWGFAEDALFLSHNQLCAGFRAGGRICLWDMRTRSHQREFLALQPRDELRCLCTAAPRTSPAGGGDEHEVVAASTSGVLRLWDLRQTARPRLDVNCISGFPGAKHYRQLNAVEMSPGIPGVVAFTATDCVQWLGAGLFDMQRNKVMSWTQSVYLDDTVSMFDAGADGRDDGLRPVSSPERRESERRTRLIRDTLFGRGDIHFMPQQFYKRASLVCFNTPDGVSVAKLPNASSVAETAIAWNTDGPVETYSSSVLNTFKLDFCRSVAVHPFINTQMLCSSVMGGISVIS